MAWSNDTRCLYCDGKLALFRKLASGQFCSAAHRKLYWSEQERLAVERLHQTHDSLRAYRPTQGVEAILGKPVHDPYAAAMADVPAPVTSTPVPEEIEELARTASNKGYVMTAGFLPEARVEPVVEGLTGRSQHFEPLEWTFAPDFPRVAILEPWRPWAGGGLPAGDMLRVRALPHAAGGFVSRSVAEWNFEMDPMAASPAATLALELSRDVVDLSRAERIAVPAPAAADWHVVKPQAQQMLFAGEQPQWALRAACVPLTGELLARMVEPAPAPDEVQAAAPVQAVAEVPAEDLEGVAPEIARPPEPPAAGPVLFPYLAAHNAPLPVIQSHSQEPIPAPEPEGLIAELAVTEATSLAPRQAGPVRMERTGSAASWLPLAASETELLPEGKDAACLDPLTTDGQIQSELIAAGNVPLPSVLPLDAETVPAMAGALEACISPLSLDRATFTDLGTEAGVATSVGGPMVRMHLRGAIAPPEAKLACTLTMLAGRPEAKVLPVLKLEPIEGSVAPPVERSLLRPATWMQGQSADPRQLWHQASDFLKNAPRDLKILAVAIPILVGLALNPSAPKVRVSAPTATEGFQSSLQKSFERRMRERFQQVRQTVAQRAAVALNEDFRGGLDDWQTPGDLATAWSFDRSGFVKPGTLALYRPSMRLTDYETQFLGLIDKKALSFVARAQDFSNYYVIKLVVANAGPMPRIGITRYAVIDGKPQSRVDTMAEISVQKDTLYRATLAVHGDTFLLGLQGKIVDTWSEPRLTRGGIGFFAARGEESRLRWVQVTHQYDMLGRLCAYLAPQNIPTTDGSW